MTSKCNHGPQLPSLDPDGNGISTWKRDINLWNSITKIPLTQRATHIYLALDGKAKLAAEQIPPEDLQSNNGLELLIQALDERFLPKKPMRIFNAYNNLRYVIRKPGVSIQDYIYRHSSMQNFS